MAQVIATNMSSLAAQRSLATTQGDVQTALERLSSGLRINGAKDDAAGLAISERFTSQINGLNQAIRNANDGTSLAQTAEGALSETTALLQRMRELSVQSANATNSATDRAALQSEVDQLKQEINRIAATTEFNGRTLLDGSFSSQAFQVGANSNQTIGISIENASGSGLGNYKLNSINDSASSQGTSAVVATTALAADNGIDAQTLTISGFRGSSTATVLANATVETVAASVNAIEASTGVSATAITKVQIGNLTHAGTVSFTLGGSSTKAISATVSSTSDLTALRDEINSVSGTTGVTAEGTGATLKLTQAAGKDITVDTYANTGNATADMTVKALDADDGLVTNGDALLTAGSSDSARVSGYVSFQSNKAFSASSDKANTTQGSIIDQAADAAAVSTEALLSSVDIGSVSGAQSAIDIVDGALATISNQRADLGALQSRFESVVSSLTASSENQTAARSRILDADFAAETARLTRGQILQQAGIAVLAQANAAPQNVLALLQ